MKETREREYELGMLPNISASLYTQFANPSLGPTTDNMNIAIHKTVILETSLVLESYESAAIIWVSSFRAVFSTAQCFRTIQV